MLRELELELGATIVLESHWRTGTILLCRNSSVRVAVAESESGPITRVAQREGSWLQRQRTSVARGLRTLLPLADDGIQDIASDLH